MWRDLRQSLRWLGRRPGFAAVAILTLALGIAANTTIFSVVDALLIRTLPFAEPERIVRIEETHERSGRSNLTGATFGDLEQRQVSFTHVGTLRQFPFNFTDGVSPELVSGAMVSRGFFGVFGVPAVLGRTFVAEEHADGGPPAVVLGHGFWTRRFAADPSVLGRSISLNARELTVVGVMPPTFAFPDGADLWLPLPPSRTLPSNRRAHLFTTVGLLRADVSLEQAGASLERLGRQIEADAGGVDAGLGFTLTGLQSRMTESMRPALWTLSAAVGLVLLIACANVANLLLARGVERERELAIHSALGAGRRALTRRLLMESLVLAVSGGLIGVLLATWSTRLLATLDLGDGLQLSGVAIDGRVLAFSLGLSLVTGILFGLLPALRASRPDLNLALKEGSGASAGPRRQRLRNLLVVGEVAVAVVLLIGGGLLARSYLSLLQVEPGYDPRNLLTTWISLRSADYDSFDKKSTFYRRLLEQVEALPGVRSAALSNDLPTRPTVSTSFEPEGAPLPDNRQPHAGVLTVSSDYFRTMGIPLLSGRTHEDRDTAAAPVAAVLNETAARLFFGDEEPLGRRLVMHSWGDPLDGTVVGVVADARHGSLDEAARPTVFYPYEQFGDRVLAMSLSVRVAGQPMMHIDAIRDRVLSLDPDLPIYGTATMEQLLHGSLGRERFNTGLIGLFGAVALGLTVVGIFSVISHSVTQRMRELGVRSALGARPADLLGLVVRQGLALTACGLAIGLVSALGLTRLLQGLLFQVSASDPVTFVSIAALVLAAAATASLLPARRAARLDPVRVLRSE